MNKIQSMSDIITNSSSEVFIMEHSLARSLEHDYNTDCISVDDITYEKMLEDILNYLGIKILQKSHKLKLIQKLSKRQELDYVLLKKVFGTRIINLEKIEVKLSKEKEGFFVQVFDENSLEEKYQITGIENITNRDFELRYNKKVKIFY